MLNNSIEIQTKRDLVITDSMKIHSLIKPITMSDHLVKIFLIFSSITTLRTHTGTDKGIKA